MQSGEVRLLDLRTAAERRRYGWPPGAPSVSLARHIAAPGGADVIYLCQHANGSKLTARNGAAEVEHGWRPLGMLSKAGADVPPIAILGIPAVIAVPAFIVQRQQTSVPARPEPADS